MHANITNSPAATATTPHPDEHRITHFVYQTGTVLAILLFLLSFWSC